MAIAIWKFELNPVVQMPSWREILSVQEQDGKLCLWAEVDPDTPLRPVRFNIFPTGVTLPRLPGRFLATVLLRGGSLVLHVYLDRE